jgi:hypothetical protein
MDPIPRFHRYRRRPALMRSAVQEVSHSARAARRTERAAALRAAYASGVGCAHARLLHEHILRQCVFSLRSGRFVRSQRQGGRRAGLRTRPAITARSSTTATPRRPSPSATSTNRSRSSTRCVRASLSRLPSSTRIGTCSARTRSLSCPTRDRARQDAVPRRAAHRVLTRACSRAARAHAGRAAFGFSRLILSVRQCPLRVWVLGHLYTARGQASPTQSQTSACRALCPVSRNGEPAVMSSWPRAGAGPRTFALDLLPALQSALKEGPAGARAPVGGLVAVEQPDAATDWHAGMNGDPALWQAECRGCPGARAA